MLRSQNVYSDFFENPATADSSGLSFRFNNVNYIKNYEGFNDFSEGYTLLGYFAQPTIQYYVNKKVAVTGGFHIQKYFGEPLYTTVRPMFSVVINLGSVSFIKLGTITNRPEQKLLEPIRHNELFLTDNIEEGVQFKHSGKIFETDTRLDWEQYIFSGSEYPEKIAFSSGNCLNFDIKRLQVVLRGQLLAAHIGGQIDNSNSNVSTIVNAALGADFILGKKQTGRYTAFAYYLPSADMSPTKRMMYDHGFGSLVGLKYERGRWNAGLKYWYGTHRLSTHENPIFRNISLQTPGYFEDERQLIIPHVFRTFDFGKNVSGGIIADAYFDVLNYDFDYTLSFIVKINFVRSILP
ncbi:MAG: hypothetical protein U9N85_05210 [Bacteroidota bacterium]|nr:hypothetical protein [Bacteroidota bacterium]